jgi:two-component system sensor histidine kinase KdpD
MSNASTLESNFERPSTQKSASFVAVGITPDSEAAIRWAQQLAASLGCGWISLYAGSPARLDADTESRITKNLALARDLGAEIVTTTSDDVAEGLLRIARARNVTHLVLEKPPAPRHFLGLRQDHTISRLLAQSGDIQIHLVGGAATPDGQGRRFGLRLPRLLRWQYLMVSVSVALITAAAFLFTPVIGIHSTALIFLLAVVGLALFVDRGPALLAAVLAATSWEYYFLPPPFDFKIHGYEDATLFCVFFIVALALGQLTSRIRAQQEAERQREERATALYVFTRELSEARSVDAVVAMAKKRFETVFHAPATIIIDNVDDPRSPSEVRVPLANNAGAIGAVALQLAPDRTLSLQERMLLEAFSQRIAFALDRLRLDQLSEQANLLVESERLSKTLLDSMSHELRTPIAAIQSATGNLAQLECDNLSNFQRAMIFEITEATERLHRLVGNALEANQLESGAVKPAFNEYQPAELIHLSLAETEKRLARHKVNVSIEPDLPLMEMDLGLMQQALDNLLSNAASHTPPGATVNVSARAENDLLVISVSDNGPGIDPALLPRVFEKFFRGPNAVTGGVGLGLSLVKGFVEAHHGTVSASLQPGGGLAFAIHVPFRQTQTIGASSAPAANP